MAVVRKTLEQIMAEGGGRVDRVRLDAVTEKNIRQQMVEDGEDPDAELRDEDVISPRFIRRRLGMTQAQFAEALHIPVATLRNWEQNRVHPDPAAMSLLRIVAREPEVALRALASAA